MSKQDYYELLGVAKGANADEIKKSYRKNAMKYHPDRNPGDKTAEAKFKELSEAYDVLKDDQKRAAYDRFGHAAFEQGGFGNAGRGAHSGAEYASNFSDIFEDLFGGFGGGRAGGRASQQALRGSDLRYNLQISLTDVYNGLEKELSINTYQDCNKCDSTGSADKSAPVTCGTCHGSGRVRMQQGFFAVEQTCPECHGAGTIVKNKCKTCGGEGRVKKQKKLSVKIPKGIEEGQRIRLAGEGEAGIRGAQSGDLYIFVTVQNHEFFERDGSNLHAEVPVRMTTAALGGTVEVPTIDGKRAKITVPSSSQTGDVLRLKGKGLPVMRSSSFGDLYVHLVVETPSNLSNKQKDILKEFESAEGKKTNPKVEGFLDKAKKLWKDLTE